MDNTTKQHITEELRNYVSKFESQNKAVTQLRNVSVATVSNILHGKDLDKISLEMWRNIAKQIGVDSKNWNIVETTNRSLLTGLFNDAALYANVFGVVGNASIGKTQTAKDYCAANPNAYLIRCDKHWTVKIFISEILHSMQMDAWCYTLPDMVEIIVKHALKAKNPVFIIDEVDKVDDKIWMSIISLYNRLEDYAGIVLMSTGAIQKRMDAGLIGGKTGYEELYSRIGKKFIRLDPNNRKNIEAVIRANGITDEMDVAEIYNTCEDDLRSVRRLVHKFNMKGGK